jgi:hypothetical protein
MGTVQLSIIARPLTNGVPTDGAPMEPTLIQTSFYLALKQCTQIPISLSIQMLQQMVATRAERLQARFLEL